MTYSNLNIRNEGTSTPDLFQFVPLVSSTYFLANWVLELYTFSFKLVLPFKKKRRNRWRGRLVAVKCHAGIPCGILYSNWEIWKKKNETRKNHFSRLDEKKSVEGKRYLNSQYRGGGVEAFTRTLSLADGGCGAAPHSGVLDNREGRWTFTGGWATPSPPPT